MFTMTGWYSSPARSRIALLLATVSIAGNAVCAAESIDRTASPPDRWAALRMLPGSWQGEVTGRLGRGAGIRRYEFLFDEQYLVARHSSVRLPQELSPEGDHHRELAVWSYDRERETLVLREFNVEGYVLQYACASADTRVVCTSESVESGGGFRARLTLQIEDRYRFTETFELAPPGEELSYYLTVEWTRAPDLHD